MIFYVHYYKTVSVCGIIEQLYQSPDILHFYKKITDSDIFKKYVPKNLQIF